MAADSTAPKQIGRPFSPGVSGNPKGRPKGSRNKLSEDFVAALQEDFNEHGKKAIQTVRADKPSDYLKIIASLVPKDFNLNVNSFEDLSDDDLRGELRDIAATLSAIIGEAGESDSDGTGAPTAH